MSDRDFMNMAYRLALKGRGKTSPNPLVGAVIVKAGKVIAEGWHRRCGADHAETLALKEAGERARGATMVVTLEPCHHYGRTPPCVDAIVKSGIKAVVIGMKDPNPMTNGRSIAKLRRAGIRVRVGVMKEELAGMNEVFVTYVTKKRPFVAVKSAQTLDGKIATAGGQSKWITSKAARDFARKVRDEYDAILVGINTVLKDDPKLTGHAKTKRLKKVILDPLLQTPTTARLFVGARPSEVILVTTAKASSRKRAALIARGADVIVAPARREMVDLKWVMRELARREIASVLVEGGARVIGSVLKARLADRMYCYIAPSIVGDKDALSSVVGMRTANVRQAVPVKDLSVTRIGKDILVQGRFKR